MFEITDEFLAQAGFGSLPADKKEQMREDVANSVQDYKEDFTGCWRSEAG